MSLPSIPPPVQMRELLRAHNGTQSIPQMHFETVMAALANTRSYSVRPDGKIEGKATFWVDPKDTESVAYMHAMLPAYAPAYTVTIEKGEPVIVNVPYTVRLTEK